jgi:hypothetical protein
VVGSSGGWKMTAMVKTWNDDNSIQKNNMSQNNNGQSNPLR